MLDQSFSAENFETIFNIENRKGVLDKDRLSDAYKMCTDYIKELQGKQVLLRMKKRINWLDREKEEYEIGEKLIKEQQKKKLQILKVDLEQIAQKANSRNFRFCLNTHTENGKDVYTINEDNEAFYVMKCLQNNIRRTFKVQAANRHSIMSQIKSILSDNLPKYIIRTDVSSFFESIPHNRLLSRIDENTLLNVKSRCYIKAILKEYDRVKNGSLYQLGLGVPRGVGISSYLSELYMTDIDRNIRQRPEVIYYARYVDDIFIVLSYLPLNITIQDYYDDLSSLFTKNSLKLKSTNDTKCSLIDLYTSVPSNQNRKFELTYLGYHLYIEKNSNKIVVQYGLSNKKKEKIKERIDKSFTRFSNESKYDIKRAKKELIDSLKQITGNIKLSNSKKGIKAGIYYTNDLLDKIEELDLLTDYLHQKDIVLYCYLFKKEEEKDRYIELLHNRIKKFDFRNNWEQRKIYDISLKQMKRMKK